MSHRQPKTGNTLEDYIVNLIEFNQLAPHLLQAENKEAFEVWFEKLELIDRRSLLIYLRKNKDKIRPEFIEQAQRRFVQQI